MKDSEIYRTAAELIDMDEENYACNAIEIVCRYIANLSQDEAYEVIGRFERMMRPNRLPKNHKDYGWYGRPKNIFFSKKYTERQSCRVLSLCFMAAIAESEGR